MKRLFISVLLLGAISVGFSQEKSNVNTKNPAELNGRLTEGERKELQAKRDLLKALDKKEAWIKSNPEELKIAEENGWFTQAEKTRVEVRKRIKELENK
jgi:hypothetical protein